MGTLQFMVNPPSAYLSLWACQTTHLKIKIAFLGTVTAGAAREMAPRVPLWAPSVREGCSPGWQRWCSALCQPFQGVVMVYGRKMVSNAISLMFHNVVVSVLNAITELRGHPGLK